jgi:hypothetical protein
MVSRQERTTGTEGRKEGTARRVSLYERRSDQVLLFVVLLICETSPADGNKHTLNKQLPVGSGVDTEPRRIISILHIPVLY